MIMRGATLLEVMLYIALTAIMLTGLMNATWQFYESVEILQSDAVLQQEMTFVFAKLRYELSGADALISGDGFLHQIVFSKDGVLHYVSLADGSLNIDDKPLVNSNLKVVDFLCHMSNVLECSLGICAVSATDKIVYGTSTIYAIIKY